MLGRFCLKKINYAKDWLREHFESIELLQAKLLLEHRMVHPPKNIHDAEFKVFSQWGEDGIIQWIISKLPSPKPIFIEFGVEDYLESNTRFLLLNNNWKGMILDGSKTKMECVKSKNFYWRHDLQAISVFVDKDNIEQIFEANGFVGEIGVLSIDIDGNDYWVWEAVSVVEPQIVICEYNSIFGADKAVTVPYNENFQRTEAHYSNLYYGASLPALEILGKRKGYSLIGSNSAGNNAFFVKDEYSSFFDIKTSKSAYVCSKFRESRDRSGGLSYLSDFSRLESIQDMPLFELHSGSIKTISEIYKI